MTSRIIYICADPLDPKNGAYWFSSIRTESDRPMKGDFAVLDPYCIAVEHKVEVLAPYRWSIESGCEIDYEAPIMIHGLEDDPSGIANWLLNHGFEQIKRDRYFDLFGVPELQTRFPAQPVS